MVEAAADTGESGNSLPLNQLIHLNKLHHIDISLYCTQVLMTIVVGDYALQQLCQFQSVEDSTRHFHCPHMDNILEYSELD